MHGFSASFSREVLKPLGEEGEVPGEDKGQGQGQGKGVAPKKSPYVDKEYSLAPASREMPAIPSAGSDRICLATLVSYKAIAIPRTILFELQ